METMLFLGIIDFVIAFIISLEGRAGYKDQYKRAIGYKRYSVICFLFYISGFLFVFSDEEPALIVGGIISFLIGVWQVIVTKMKINKAIKDGKKYCQEVEKARENANYNQKAKQIYNTCIKHNLNEIKTEKQKEDMMIIAEQYEIKNIDEAIKMFNLGKELQEKEEEQNEIEKLKSLREKDQKYADENYEKTKIIGKAKYTQVLEDDISYAQKVLKLANDSEKLAKLNMNYTPRKTDWAIWGGIANGLAGPAAGIATAMDIQRSNEKAEENAKNTRERAWDDYYRIQELKRELPKAIEKDKNYIEKINEKLYSDKNQEELFKKIKIKDTNYRIKNSKNFIVEFSISTEETKLIDSETIIDGSVLIKVLNKNKDVIAKGYYSAPGFKDYEFKKVGFNSISQISAICITEDNYILDVNEEEKYECTLEYINLWQIEK